MNHHLWPTRRIEPLGITVGPWAWGAGALLDAHQEDVCDKPSLVMIDTTQFNETRFPDLARAIKRLHETTKNYHSIHGDDFPVMLCLPQPRFARRLPDVVVRHMALLSLAQLDVLTLHVDDAQDLKSGGVLQEAFRLRDQGVIQHIGLASSDVRSAEWMALHTAVRLLMFPYNLTDQSASYRLLQAANDSAMTCVTTAPMNATIESIRFALGQAHQVLPIFNHPPPPGVTAMSPDEIDDHWHGYRQSHDEPPPLPRGLPPDA